MTEQSGNTILTEIMSELAQLRQKIAEQDLEIARLKTELPAAAPALTTPLKNSRRQLLRHLVGGMAITLTAGAFAAGQPKSAQAGSLVANSSRYGLISVPTGTTITAFPSVTAATVGIAATGDSTVDFSTGIPGGSTGVFGKTANGTGIFGTASGTGIGVRGNSTDGNGVVAFSTDGAPFRIQAGNQPTTGMRTAGEFYVATGSPAHLFFFNGTAWVQVI